MKLRKFTFTTLFISVALTACGSSTHSSSESSTTANALVTTTGASVTTTEVPVTTTEVPVTTTEVPATTPPIADVRIVYVSWVRGNAELYVMNTPVFNVLSGRYEEQLDTGVRRLTDNDFNHRWPAWSPDGSQITFSSFQDASWDIYIMNADGTNVRQLTDGFWGEQASWSPDGTQLAFSGYKDGNESIFVMNVDGTEVEQLTNADRGDDDPAWSPDGTQIVFSSDRDGDSEIFVMNADGTNVRQLTDNSYGDSNKARDGQATWSPDGTQIVFSSDRDGDSEIFVMNADGTNVRQLTDNDDLDEFPVWSPDGSQIIFSNGWKQGITSLFVMNADGSEVHSIRAGDRAGFPSVTLQRGTISLDERTIQSFDGQPLDFQNATFYVRCPGMLGGGSYPYLATFVDGKIHKDNNPFGASGTLRVTKLAEVELVDESPGLEIIVEVFCHGGGSGYSEELQIFATNPDEPTRLGSILHHQDLLYAVDPEIDSPGSFVIYEYDWAPEDPDWNPTIRRTHDVHWNGEDWERALLEEWRVSPAEQILEREEIFEYGEIYFEIYFRFPVYPNIPVCSTFPACIKTSSTYDPQPPRSADFQGSRLN